MHLLGYRCIRDLGKGDKRVKVMDRQMRVLLRLGDMGGVSQSVLAFVHYSSQHKWDGWLCVH
jgi:hypothetical protein